MIALLAFALVAYGVAGCGIATRQAVDALEDAMGRHPEVVATGLRYDGGTLKSHAFLTAALDVRADAAPERVGVIVRELVDGLRAEEFAEFTGQVRISRGPGYAALGTWAPATLELDLGDLPAGGSVEADARLWARLSSAFPEVRMELHGQPSPGVLPRQISVSAPVGSPPDALVPAYDTLVTIAGDALPGTRWAIGFPNPPSPDHPDTGTGYGSRGTLPAPVLEAMRSLAEVEGLAAPDDRVTLGATWSTGPDGPAHLAVDIDLDLVEFSHVPTNRIPELVPGSTAEKLGRAYVERLDASGLPYTLTARLFTAAPYLDLDRRIR